MAYSAGIADAIVASYLGSILPLLMCADLQLQAEAATLVGWLACSSSENACAIGSFDSFVSYIAILMGSTSSRVQKQVTRTRLSSSSARAQMPAIYSHYPSGMLGYVCPQRRQQPWKDHQCSSVRRPPSRATFPLHPSHIRTVTIDLHDHSSPPWAAMTLQHSCTRAGNPPSAACPGVSRAPQVCHLHRSGPPFKRHFNIPHRWPHG